LGRRVASLVLTQEQWNLLHTNSPRVCISGVFGTGEFEAACIVIKFCSLIFFFENVYVKTNSIFSQSTISYHFLVHVKKGK
jgi:hypothetical protein